MSDWSKHTLQELVQVAIKAGVEPKIIATMTRDELVEAIEAQQPSPPPAQSTPTTPKAAPPQAPAAPAPKAAAPLKTDAKLAAQDSELTQDASANEEAELDAEQELDAEEAVEENDEVADEEATEDDEPATEEPHPHEGESPLLAPLELGGIPVGYNRTYLGLMVQSPGTLFSYWSFADAETAAAFYQGAPAQVRLYDITDGQNALIRQEDIEVTAGRWFIYDVAPDRRYKAELGVLRDGAFEVRLTSRVAQTPPSGPSRLLNDVFLTIDHSQSLAALRADLRHDPAFMSVRLDQHASASERDHASATEHHQHSGNGHQHTVLLPAAAASAPWQPGPDGSPVANTASDEAHTGNGQHIGYEQSGSGAGIHRG